MQSWGRRTKESQVCRTVDRHSDRHGREMVCLSKVLTRCAASKAHPTHVYLGGLSWIQGTMNDALGHVAVDPAA